MSTFLVDAIFLTCCFKVSWSTLNRDKTSECEYIKCVCVNCSLASNSIVCVSKEVRKKTKWVGEVCQLNQIILKNIE